MQQIPQEVVWRLPRAQALTIMSLLTSHPYNQVADLLHTLQTQLNEPPPQPGAVGSVQGGVGGGNGAA